MLWVILAILWIWSDTVFCKLEDHFKKAENKSNYHNMRNIDFIYMINLDKRPGKFKKSADQLAPYQIYPYRFSAINGWEDLSLEVINDVGVKYDPKTMRGGYMATYFPIDGDGKGMHEEIHTPGRAYFVHSMAKGTIAIMLSHLSVLQDAWDSGYETIWVMEDDIDVVRNPTKIPDLIDELDTLVGRGNWDILFTDLDFRAIDGANGWKYVPCSTTDERGRLGFNNTRPNKYDLKVNVNANFRRIGARFGCHSMIIRRSGLKKILDFEKNHNIFLPIDIDMFLPVGVKYYTVRKDIVTNMPGGPSDNGAPNYGTK